MGDGQREALHPCLEAAGLEAGAVVGAEILHPEIEAGRAMCHREVVPDRMPCTGAGGHAGVQRHGRNQSMSSERHGGA
jgi:hypothetical protein